MRVELVKSHPPQAKRSEDHMHEVSFTFTKWSSSVPIVFTRSAQQRLGFEADDAGFQVNGSGLEVPEDLCLVLCRRVTIPEFERLVA